MRASRSRLCWLPAAGLLAGFLNAPAAFAADLAPAAQFSHPLPGQRPTAAGETGGGQPAPLPAILEKNLQEHTACVVATRGDRRQYADGVILAGQNQVLIAWSAIAPTAAAFDPAAEHPFDAVKPDSLTVYVSGRAGLPQKESAQLTWVDPDHDLALLTVKNLGNRGAKLTVDAVPGAERYAAHYTVPADADFAVLPDLTALPGGKRAGAPLFDAQGHWLGLAVKNPQAKAAGDLPAATLRDLLFGQVRGVTLDPPDFNPAAGGRVTLQVDFQAGLGAARSLTAALDGVNQGRAVALRYNPKSRRYEAPLTLSPAPSAIDRPVDESKLPDSIQLQFKFNCNHMVAKRSGATPDKLYAQNFLNKFFECTIDGRRRKIYFGAIVHAAFAPDGTATLLTVDNRTLTGRLESQFTYKVSGMNMNWTAGADEFAYIEVPGAKATPQKVTLKVTVEGAAADGAQLTPFSATLP